MLEDGWMNNGSLELNELSVKKQNRFKISLPINIVHDSEYEEKLELKLHEYLDFIKSGIVKQNINIKLIEEIVSLLKQSIYLYFNLKTDNAQECVNKIIDIIEKNCKNDLISDPFSIYKGAANYSRKHCRDENYYKARVESSCFRFNKKDMLHVPFDKRSKVKAQRFSIPGCPCMYLGKSSYICWKELDKPEASKFNVSAIKPSMCARVLNLAYVNKELFEALLSYDSASVNKGDFDFSLLKVGETKEAYIENYIKNAVLVYPLIIATSFTVKEMDRDFKTEYLISQMIMNSLIKKGYDGVAYISKKSKDNWKYFPANLVIALIARKNNKEDVLSSKLSECNHCKPVNYSEYLMIGNQDIYYPYSLNDSTKNCKYLFASHSMEYLNSSFERFDRYLNIMMHFELKK